MYFGLVVRHSGHGYALPEREMQGGARPAWRPTYNERFAWKSTRSSSAEDNIVVQVPLTVAEAGLGAKIEVPTIDGRAILKIPQGTQNGQKFRLREKGVFNARKNSRGDEIVEVVLRAPDVHDERTRELLRELAQVQKEDVRSEMWRHVQPAA